MVNLSIFLFLSFVLFYFQNKKVIQRVENNLLFSIIVTVLCNMSKSIIVLMFRVLVHLYLIKRVCYKIFGNWFVEGSRKKSQILNSRTNWLRKKRWLLCSNKASSKIGYFVLYLCILHFRFYGIIEILEKRLNVK